MGVKEDLHKLKITPIISPIAEAATAIKSAATPALDTAGFESNMLILNVGTGGAADWVLGLYANDTSTTTAGTIVTGRDVIFAVDNDAAATIGTTAAGLWVQSTGTLTLTGTQAGRIFMFAYTGNKRYIRLYSASATTSTAYSVTAIQGHFRYQGRDGLHATPYLGTA
jgi:hypothetical protein